MFPKFGHFNARLSSYQRGLSAKPLYNPIPPNRGYVVWYVTEFLDAEGLHQGGLCSAIGNDMSHKLRVESRTQGAAMLQNLEAEDKTLSTVIMLCLM